MCQLHISLTRAAQIYLELHFCVELNTKKSPDITAFNKGIGSLYAQFSIQYVDVGQPLHCRQCNLIRSEILHAE